MGIMGFTILMVMAIYMTICMAIGMAVGVDMVSVGMVNSFGILVVVTIIE